VVQWETLVVTVFQKPCPKRSC